MAKEHNESVVELLEASARFIEIFKAGAKAKNLAADARELRATAIGLFDQFLSDASANQINLPSELAEGDCWRARRTVRSRRHLLGS